MNERVEVLERLNSLLLLIGTANDADDHNCGEEGSQLRIRAAGDIEAMILQYPFVTEVLPTLEWELATGHIEGFGWSNLVDALQIELEEARGETNDTNPQGSSMSENKTQETEASVEAFLEAVENDTRRKDAYALLALMQRATGAPPKMWGPAIVGFGKYRYRYDSGREGEMLRVGFSPRKGNLAIYLIASDHRLVELKASLGKHKTGASCLYVTKLADVDPQVLESMVSRSWELARETYGEP